MGNRPQMKGPSVNLPNRVPEPSATLRHLSKSYEGRAALNIESVAFFPSECVWICGENGSGKSTLLRILAGLIDPDVGDATICDAPAGSRSARRAVSFVPDIPALYEDLSVWEHCQYVAGLHELTADTAERRSTNVLQTLGLWPRRGDLPRFLSRGLRQKLSLALAFVRPARVVLLDEPFEGLDDTGVSGLNSLLQAAILDSSTVVVTGQRAPSTDSPLRVLRLRDGGVESDSVEPARTVRELRGAAE